MPAVPGQSAHFTTSTASWKVLASDMTGYDTLAAVASAGKVPWPGLDAGMNLSTLAVKCENGSSADGSPFYIAYNQASAPTDDQAILVSGSGQTLVWNGVNLTHSGPMIHNIWVRKTTAGDEIIFLPDY
jgi:hypothetical protein